MERATDDHLGSEVFTDCKPAVARTTIWQAFGLAPRAMGDWLKVNEAHNRTPLELVLIRRYLI